jgi:mannose-6-phosphate isomerase-like protein (cupin superfamily)
MDTTYINLVTPLTYHKTEENCMLPFQLDSLNSKELYNDVLVRLVHGNDLTLNYFELTTKTVDLPIHEHPVEHLVVVLEGVLEFIFQDKKAIMNPKDSMFVPAKTPHTARVIDGPVKALEIYKVIEDKYYNR